jgi:hypothetical protein
LAALLSTNGIRKARKLNSGEDFIVEFVNRLGLVHVWHKELVTRLMFCNWTMTMRTILLILENLNMDFDKLKMNFCT